MHVALWGAQGWLAALFLVAGLTKLAGAKATLERRPGMGYLANRSVAQMRLLGLAEVAGAAGLTLPGLLRRAPALTAVAAVCLAVLMIGAVAVHVRRRESPLLPAVLAAAALFVAVGRSGLLS